jgi:hypothetical protein
MRNKETGKYQYRYNEKGFSIDVKDFLDESIEFHVVATKEQMEELTDQFDKEQSEVM